MIVVSDTSPIRALEHLGLLNLLRELFEEVLIPPAVISELQRAMSDTAFSTIMESEFVRVEAPRNPVLVQRFSAILDPGESEALALALEVGATVILMDEVAGRAAAREAGSNHLARLESLLKPNDMGTS